MWRSLIVVSFILPSVGMAANLTIQQPSAQMIGFMPTLATNTTVVTSTGLLGIGFVAPASPFSGTMRLQDITIYVSAVNTAPKLTAKLVSDNAGVPNYTSGVIETGTESAALSAGNWYTLSGFTTTSNLTAGTQYWIVLVCTTGTSVTVQYTIPGTLAFPPIGAYTAGSGMSWGETSATSADTGSTWTGGYGGIAGFRIGFTDGTDNAYRGIAISAFAWANGATEKLFTDTGTAQEVGSRFTMPANAKVSVCAVGMQARQSGPPTGNLRFRIYSGSEMTLLGTTLGIPPGNVRSGGLNFYISRFTTPITMSAGTLYTVTAGNTAADDSTHYHSVYKYTIQNDATSAGLLPFGGMVLAKNSGGSWSTVTTEVVPFAIYLCTGSEFLSVSAGGPHAWVQ